MLTKEQAQIQAANRRLLSRAKAGDWKAWQTLQGKGVVRIWTSEIQLIADIGPGDIEAPVRTGYEALLEPDDGILGEIEAEGTA